MRTAGTTTRLPTTTAAAAHRSPEIKNGVGLKFARKNKFYCYRRGRSGGRQVGGGGGGHGCSGGGGGGSGGGGGGGGGRRRR